MVWQSCASAGVCQRLRDEGHEETFRNKTGLLLDPYSYGSKVRYMPDQDANLQARAERGEILFGTVDTWLIWRMTGGRRHATDVSNASRTLMFDIHTLDWDDELLAILDIPRVMLPEVCSSSAVYRETYAALFGRTIPIAGDAGDQQAATFGQACFEPGRVKKTYGAGCFMLLNTGPPPLAS